MQSIPLQTIQDYCKGKSIIIVGNSTGILKCEYGQFIDSHQIIVRMNYAYPVNTCYSKNIGRNTHIYMAGISRAIIVEKIVSQNPVRYILRLTPCGEPLNIKNVYCNTKQEYNQLKQHFGEFKPSSGSLTINFFKEHIDYKSLTIIGFDFFKKAHKIKKNEFKSYLYRDHDCSMEQEYITKCLNNNTKLINT